MQTQDLNLLSFITDYCKQGFSGPQPYVLNNDLRQKVLDECLRLKRLCACGQQESREELHRVLAVIYDYRFSVPSMETVDVDISCVFADITTLLEPVILQNEIDIIPADIFDQMPTNGSAFVSWFKQLISQHPAGAHPFFQNYLRDSASVEAFRTFLAQETTLDPRFDDILALMQVGTVGAEKMEIAKNYFDEMGNGDEREVHTLLFSKALKALNVDAAYIDKALLPEARVCGNLSACLALSPRHHYKAIGYFGVTEYLAPRRFKKLVAGWRRLGLPEFGLAYHDLHIRIDAIHGKGWFDNVIEPAVEQDPRVIREILYGALIRLNSSNTFLDALLAHVQRQDRIAQPQNVLSIA
jgi:hypothetical protein